MNKREVLSTPHLKEWSMIWIMLILFPQTSSLLIRKLCCMCLKTTKQWTPKTKSQTCWPRETSHVMNGIIFCVSLTLAISDLQSVLKWCRNEQTKNQVKKESQQSRDQWWIWSRDAVKGLPPRYLPLHQKARGKPRHESQSPLSPQAKKYDRTVRPVVYAHSSSYSEWNVDKTCSSQEWKSDELMEVRTGRPVVFAQHTDRFIVENDNMDSYTEAESELSLKIQIILAQGEWSSAKEAVPIFKRCNKRQRQTFCNMENVYVFNIASICIHGEELLRQLAFHKKKQKIFQWNRCSTYLRSE